VIARTTAVVEAGGVLGRLECAPPLTLRQVGGEDPDVCELRLVGTAAGPLAGDDLSLGLVVTAGARAALGAAGASLAQGREGDGAARLRVRGELGAGSSLVARPGPLIVCAGSRVDIQVELVLAEGAAVEWYELVVLGRSGEAAGAATLRWDVTRSGRPVLRQLTDLAAGAGVVTAGRRVMGCALISDPGRAARTVVGSRVAVAQRVAEHTLLVTVLGDDTASVTRQVEDLCGDAMIAGTLDRIAARTARDHENRWLGAGGRV
jgi:urease accessory protein